VKTNNLSIKELAAFIRVSTDTIRRAVRKGEIPATRVKTALRFDLQKVLTCMQRNAETKFGTRSASAIAGASRRRAPKSPRSVKRGRNFQGSSRRVS
jgi:excisionase family DNA binding protein